ncbi:DUF4416 family protein [Leptospira santarosai]|uniref:PF14385 domain protein n=2 Tax=Leptospira santarosai TaxID=28183 RepID=A0AB73LVQ3_9LEPT|nr:DUF4416 family protein [Leptospira santarosai]AVV49307.1 Uncharacterized protein XB17_00698 [Leptospira santarosai]EKO31875.1 PF14385 domain protein [Leptospira santarosai str. MOR084]EKR91943.1 PF14385 domain protein [Leptospira santarosai str. CBC379]EMF89389.1 PF14385 domain protein [Leptospira santarosai str. ST188]EMM78209.1 PF14385 domain protein [Leptospira santarosai str. 2000030832]
MNSSKKNPPPTKDKLAKPSGASFFIVVVYEDTEMFYSIKTRTEKKFSATLYESNPMPTWTDPNEELWNRFSGRHTKILSFKRRIHREELPSIQKECLTIQNAAIEKDRGVRIFPGYLCNHSVVISSIQDDFHRIYLFNGVYAETVYNYQKQKMVCRETAPPFFKTPEALYFFTSLRESYVQNINKI